MTTSRLTNVLTDIDNINALDPNEVLVDGQPQPKERVYARQMSACLAQHWPDADELLQIAVHAQHIKRWSLKRDEYDAGKVGYLKWRKAQAVHHAQLTEAIMLAQGYNAEQRSHTGAVIRKEKLKSDPQAQALEDVACLVFLSHYFDEFAQKHEEPKIIGILQKTWKKMSEKAQGIALKLDLPEHLATLVGKALG
jgi:hypothetical protein